jgi:hypothetical protein
VRTMILAAVAATGLTGVVAYAGDGDVPSANTLFTQIPGAVTQAPTGILPSTGTAQQGGPSGNRPSRSPGYLPLSSLCRVWLGIDGADH